MTTDQALTGAALHAWTQHIERADKFFAGLSETQLLAQVAPGRNRLIYLWGHLTAVHDAMLPLLDLGPRQYPDLEALFLSGADDPSATYPPVADIQTRWRDVNARLRAGFEAFTADDWTAKHTAVSAADFAANPLRNRFAVLLSRTAHVQYHYGQAVLAGQKR